MKKRLSLAILLIMLVAFVAPAAMAADSRESHKQKAGAGAAKAGKTAPEGILLTWTNDGATKVTDPAFDTYFKAGALAGVEALLDAGKVYVNGRKIPATENEVTVYQVNKVNAIYKTETGWGYSVHKTTSANDMAFKDARLAFLQTLTTVRGHTVTLYRDGASKHVSRIDANNVECVVIASIDIHNENTNITRCDFTLEGNRNPPRPDVNNEFFPSSNVDRAIEPGDIAVFWYGATGWNLKRGVPVTGILTKSDEKTVNKYIIDGTDARIESNVSRYNLRDANRPTQFYTAHTRLGLQSIPVTTWCTDTGNPIGFTHGTYANAKAALALAIANAKAAKAGVVVSSTNGSDVPAGTKWVAQAAMDAFDAAIAAAEAVYNNNLSAIISFDDALYKLSAAYGVGGNSPAGFIGAQGTGTKAQ